jgi:large subunit ribosomal protein L13
MGTFVAKQDDLTRKWFVIDADGQPLGRVAVEAAKLLRGKHKPIFTPNVDCGDHVIIINAAKAVLTGNSKPDELIYHHSGFPGGIKSEARGHMLDKTPVKSMTKAVKGMLPHNKLGDAIFRKLRVYAGADHTQEAQQPVEFKFS